MSFNEIEVLKPSRVTSYDGINEWQKRAAEAVLEGASNYLWLGEHDSVITLGRAADPKNILLSKERLEDQGILVREINRGGDVTWHGPGQLVGYPILNLKFFKEDLHWYLRQLETVLIETLEAFEVRGEVIEGKTGVWVNSQEAYKKIASIGVHVSRWISSHGFALNISPDLAAFQTINACGLNCEQTSLKSILGDRCPSFNDVRDCLVEKFAAVFQTKILTEEVLT